MRDESCKEADRPRPRTSNGKWEKSVPRPSADCQEESEKLWIYDRTIGKQLSLTVESAFASIQGQRVWYRKTEVEMKPEARKLVSRSGRRRKREAEGNDGKQME